MSHPERDQHDPTETWDWRAALKAHPIGRFGGLAWLADTLGMPRRTIYAYSRGDRRIPVGWIERVRAVLVTEGSEDGRGSPDSGN